MYVSPSSSMAAHRKHSLHVVEVLASHHLRRHWHSSPLQAELVEHWDKCIISKRNGKLYSCVHYQQMHKRSRVPVLHYLQESLNQLLSMLLCDTSVELIDDHMLDGHCTYRMSNFHLILLHRCVYLTRMKLWDVQWVVNLWDWKISFLLPSRLPKMETRERSLLKTYAVLLLPILILWSALVPTLQWIVLTFCQFSTNKICLIASHICVV